MKEKKNNMEVIPKTEMKINNERKSQIIEQIVKKQKAFFETGKTKDINYRKDALKKLKQAIIEHEAEIHQALKQDLNKSEMESYMTETGMVLSELSYAIKHVKSWSKKKRVRTPIAQFHSSSYEMYEPYGVSLIIAPWNYPFMLAIDPLVGAIAAGN
ncbi:MAG: aldehyde dehydrogenase family protein, partial [Intestinibacter sp.]